MNPPEVQGQGEPGAQGLRLIIQACQRLYPQQPNPLQVYFLSWYPCNCMTWYKILLQASIFCSPMSSEYLSSTGDCGCEVLARRARSPWLHFNVCQPRFNLSYHPPGPGIMPTSTITITQALLTLPHTGTMSPAAWPTCMEMLGFIRLPPVQRLPRVMALSLHSGYISIQFFFFSHSYTF